MTNYHQHITEHQDVIARDLRLLTHLIPHARRILDIGCGTGAFLGHVSPEITAVGVELSLSAAQACQAQRLSVCIADGNRLPFSGGAFDVVRAKELLEHLLDPLSLLKEMRRVLDDRGVIVVHVPTNYSLFYPIGNFYNDYTHIRPFSRFGLVRVLEDAGFSVIKILGYTSGRNALESIIGNVLAKLLPHTWMAIAKRR